jgi:hypothetical protein
MAGGRWARQSYYDAIYKVACNILEDAETYMALKGHLQRAREHVESDPIPVSPLAQLLNGQDDEEVEDETASVLVNKIESSKISELSENLKAMSVNAIKSIERADALGHKWMKDRDKKDEAVAAYKESFVACAAVLELDNLAFQARWFKDFWRRNYDSLMVLSIYENLVDDVDNVREWMDSLKSGSDVAAIFKLDGEDSTEENTPSTPTSSPMRKRRSQNSFTQAMSAGDFFKSIGDGKHDDMEVVKNIIDSIFFDEAEKVKLHADPLVHLLIPNPEGKYNFTLISAMGVITEGKKGTELEDAYSRILSKRGIQTIRADTATYLRLLLGRVAQIRTQTMNTMNTSLETAYLDRPTLLSSCRPASRRL